MSGCSEASNGDISTNKKRKLDVPVRDITEIQSVDDSSGKACNVVREDKAAFITNKEDNERNIKWKKFIKLAEAGWSFEDAEAAKTGSQGPPRIRCSRVGDDDKSQLSEMLEH
ncbi:hypothetical protein Gotur_015366 [Gossypium turneri]